MNQVIIFIICLLISVLLPTLLGAPYSEYEKKWYKHLNKPTFAVPDIVFILIFPIFYILEAIGLFFIFTNQNSTPILLLGIIYLLSALLSGVWSRLFFIYKRCDLSLWAFFLELPVSWVFVFLLYQEPHMAWIFFVPRVVWGFYAIIVNVQFYRLNISFWDTEKLQKKKINR